MNNKLVTVLTTDKYSVVLEKINDYIGVLNIVINNKSIPTGIGFHIWNDMITNCGSERNNEFAILQISDDRIMRLIIVKVDTKLPKTPHIYKYLLEKNRSLKYHLFTYDNKSNVFTIGDKPFSLRNLREHKIFNLMKGNLVTVLTTDNYNLVVEMTSGFFGRLKIVLDGEYTTTDIEFHLRTDTIIQYGIESNNEFAILRVSMDKTYMELILVKVNTNLKNKVEVIGVYILEEIVCLKVDIFLYDNETKKFTINNRTFELKYLEKFVGDPHVVNRMSTVVCRNLLTLLSTDKYILIVSTAGKNKYDLSIIIDGKTTPTGMKFHFDWDCVILEYNTEDTIGFAIVETIPYRDITIVRVDPKLPSKVEVVGVYDMGIEFDTEYRVPISYDNKTKKFTVGQSFSLEDLKESNKNG